MLQNNRIELILLKVLNVSFVTICFLIMGSDFKILYVRVAMLSLDISNIAIITVNGVLFMKKLFS